MLLEGDEVRSLHAETGEIVRRREREIPYLLGDATDLQFLEDVEVPDVAQQLELATAQADALHLALILLDRQLPHDVRRDAADELAELLEIAGVRESVESVLLSHPLPMEADLTGALSCCPGRAEASRALLLRIQALQSEVRDVFFAWEQIPGRVFEDERNRAFALSTAIRQGFFRQLVTLRAEHRPVDEFLAEAHRNAFSHARNHRDILRDWLAPLREPKSSAPMLHVAFERRDQIVAEVGDEAQQGSRGSRAPLDQIEHQKAAVVDEMRRHRRFDRVDTFVSELIEAATPETPTPVTRLLHDWSNGDPEALERLIPLVVNDLRQMANRLFAREPLSHTLQPTALVSEVFLKLQDQREIQWENREQFFAVAAMLMRRILVDNAKGRHTKKRGVVEVPLEKALNIAEAKNLDVGALDDALSRLAELDPRQARIVELRFFTGLKHEEIADLLEVSVTTVKREWRSAQLWLHWELGKRADR